jgi:NTE family protein
MNKRKVGLALGAGSARGLAHIGVLKVLTREHIPIDMVSGTSAGALIGGMFASGKTPEEIEKIVRNLIARRYSLFADPALPVTGLIRGKKIRDTLKLIYGDLSFNDLKLPFACMTTDINTGEAVTVDEGSVLDAVQASSTLPVLMTLIKWNGRYLVDGALVNPIPVKVLKSMGADLIIAVNVSSNGLTRMESTKAPGIFKVAMHALHISTSQSLHSSLTGADVIIEPCLANLGHFEFQRIDECIRIGEKTAEEALPEIKERLAALQIELAVQD